MNKKCLVCGKEFVLLKSGKRNRIYNNRKYCSGACMARARYLRNHDYYKTYWESKYRGLILKPCEYCGKEFLSKRDTTLTCSSRCSKKLWKKKNWQKVLKDQRAWFKRKRIEDPERFRMLVKNRKHKLRETSCSTKSISKDFTLQDWEDIKKKQSYTCPLCKKSEPEIKLTIDHIYPLRWGGRHEKANIQGLCFSCNSRKKDSLPHTNILKI